MLQIKYIRVCLYSRRASTEKIDRQREKRLREKNVKCPKSKVIRICLKECFHREKKD
jgi:hypothetical protein